MTTNIAFPPSPPVYAPPAHAMSKGIAISRYYGMTITPVDVARVLDRAKVRYVLAGAHAINLYTGKPRATEDVDVVTDAPNKARRALEAAYPHLSVDDQPVVIRFKDGDTEVLDVIKSTSGPLFRRVLRLVQVVEIEGQPVATPTWEAALAMKFSSMISIARRRSDRMQDATDFARAAERPGDANMTLLAELGELVYPGGGAELLKLFTDARAGRALNI